MLALLTLFLIMCYVQIGIHLGRKSLDIWESKDSESLLAFLFFPTSYARGKVGEPDLSAITAMFDAFNRHDKSGYWWYRTLMSIFWGLRLIWNLPAVLFLGVGEIFKALSGLSLDKKWRARRVKKGQKPAEQLSPEEELVRLHALEAELQQKIADCIARREVDSLEDPEVARCRAAAAAVKKQAAGGGAW